MAKSFDLDTYNTVAERIAEFREKHPDGSLQQVRYELLEVGEKMFIAYTAAAYRNPDDKLPGIGCAWEPVPGPTQFTRDSEMQNAETAAWGRAIVAALAADTTKGVASWDEIENRGSNPEPDPALAAEVAAANEARGELLAKTKQFGWTPETLQKRFFEDYKKSLLATRDVTLIEGFGRILLEEAQLRKLNTLLSRERLTGHDARVAWCSDALGIPVESTKELTPDQVTRLIDKLENTTQEEPK